MDALYDVIIIGAGPAGLGAAIYTGRSRLNTLVLEKAMPGGQILLTDWVENYPGFPDGVSPFELMENFRRQADKFGAKIDMKEVQSIRKEKKLWVVTCSDTEHQTRTVIIATGTTHRKLNVKGEEKLIGKGVSYCATCDGAFFKDKVVGVAGGGSLALTEALFLTKFCRKVKIIHRREGFRAEKILQERVNENDKVELVLHSVIEEISGQTKLDSVKLRNTRDDSFSILKLDGLFVAIGMDANSGIVKDLVELDDAGSIKVGKLMTTSQPGIFAAGDVTDACPEQLATAAGTGVAAAIAVDEYLSSVVR